MMEGFQTFCSHQNDGGSETSLKKLASPSSVPLAPAPPLHRRFGPVCLPTSTMGSERRTEDPLEARGDQEFTISV